MSRGFIEKQKKFYKSLKPCYCSVLKQKVYFNSSGLNHLLYKGRRPREIKDKISRLKLIKYIPNIIKYSEKARKKEYKSCNLWILDSNISNRKIRVILKQTNKIYFLSVMKLKKKPRN